MSDLAWEWFPAALSAAASGADSNVAYVDAPLPAGGWAAPASPGLVELSDVFAAGGPVAVLDGAGIDLTALLGEALAQPPTPFAPSFGEVEAVGARLADPFDLLMAGDQNGRATADLALDDFVGDAGLAGPEPSPVAAAADEHRPGDEDLVLSDVFGQDDVSDDDGPPTGPAVEDAPLSGVSFGDTSFSDASHSGDGDPHPHLDDMGPDTLG